jgi:hypothetical protein
VTSSSSSSSSAAATTSTRARNKRDAPSSSATAIDADVNATTNAPTTTTSTNASTTSSSNNNNNNNNVITESSSSTATNITINTTINIAIKNAAATTAIATTKRRRVDALSATPPVNSRAPAKLTLASLDNSIHRAIALFDRDARLERARLRLLGFSDEHASSALLAACTATTAANTTAATAAASTTSSFEQLSPSARSLLASCPPDVVCCVLRLRDELAAVQRTAAVRVEPTVAISSLAQRLRKVRIKRGHSALSTAAYAPPSQSPANDRSVADLRQRLAKRLRRAAPPAATLFPSATPMQRRGKRVFAAGGSSVVAANKSARLRFGVRVAPAAAPKVALPSVTDTAAAAAATATATAAIAAAAPEAAVAPKPAERAVRKEFCLNCGVFHEYPEESDDDGGDDDDDDGDDDDNDDNDDDDNDDDDIGGVANGAAVNDAAFVANDDDDDDGDESPCSCPDCTGVNSAAATSESAAVAASHDLAVFDPMAAHADDESISDDSEMSARPIPALRAVAPQPTTAPLFVNGFGAIMHDDDDGDDDDDDDDDDNDGNDDDDDGVDDDDIGDAIFAEDESMFDAALEQLLAHRRLQ